MGKYFLFFPFPSLLFDFNLDWRVSVCVRVCECEGLRNVRAFALERLKSKGAGPASSVLIRIRVRHRR